MVILASVGEDIGIEPARELRDQSVDFGVPAEIFLSTDFNSLNPNFWVVYTGEFDNPEAAIVRCAELTGLVADCCHRLVANE